jgi:hypothetical protein
MGAKLVIPSQIPQKDSFVFQLARSFVGGLQNLRHLSLKIFPLKSGTQAGYCSGENLDLYSGGIGFEFRWDTTYPG